MNDLDQFVDRFSGLSEEYKFYGGTVTLQYEPKSHTYFLVRPNGELEPQQGVTSVCHIIDKSKQLIPWGCKMMAAKLLANIPTQAVTVGLGKELVDGGIIVPSIDFADFEHLVLDAKTAHKEKLEEAAELGSFAHSWVERYIKSILANGPDSEITQEILSNFPFDDRVKNCCYAALDWMRKHNVRWLSAERKIYSRKHKYAGTADGFALVDSCDDPACCPVKFKDRFSNVDWKSSNYLYIEYILQGAAYTAAYNEESLSDYLAAVNGSPINSYIETPSMITDRWVIRLGKEDAEFDPWHCEEGTFKADLNAFLEALALKNSVEAIEKRMDAYTTLRREAKKQAKKAATAADKQKAKEEKAAKKAEAKAKAKEDLKIKCKGADRYRGVRRPTCNDGKGCQTCITIYQNAQAAKKVSQHAAASSLLSLLK
jgi:hypothetical protein